MKRKIILTREGRACLAKVKREKKERYAYDDLCRGLRKKDSNIFMDMLCIFGAAGMLTFGLCIILNGKIFEAIMIFIISAGLIRLGFGDSNNSLYRKYPEYFKEVSK